MKSFSDTSLSIAGQEIEEVQAHPWPTLALEVAGSAIQWSMGGVEEQLQEGILRGQRFMVAYHRLGTIDAKVVEEETNFFTHTQNRLLDSLEFLRLRSLSKLQQLELRQACCKALVAQRRTRGDILDLLPEGPRRTLISRDVRLSRTTADLRETLQERQNLRSFGQRNVQRHDAVDQLRQWKQLRAGQDARLVDFSWSTRQWLTHLPSKWLEGLSLRHNIPADSAQIDGITQALQRPGHLNQTVMDLPLVARLALEKLIHKNGKILWNQLLWAHGGEDDNAWNWGIQPPTTALERLRRCGLYYVGAKEKCGGIQLWACIPNDLHEPLRRIIAQSPRNPETRWNLSISL